MHTSLTILLAQLAVRSSGTQDSGPNRSDSLVRKHSDWLNDIEASELLQGDLATEVLSACGGDINVVGGVQAGSGGSASLYLREVHHREHALLRALAIRTADTLGVHLAHIEPAVLTRYSAGQRYGIHHDAGYVNRSGTLICYLNTIPAHGGGQTVFLDRSIYPDVTLSEVCSTTWPSELKVRPIKGLAVSWQNLNSEGDMDSRSFHGSCPVIGKVKWILQFWVSVDCVQFWAA
eukprot:m.206842 g.206842  ORF g.206842 m.206842 type:complete len:234 (+) comp15437_c0_seq4:57-758(+)